MARNLTFNRVIQSAYQPISAAPTVVNTTSSTTAATITADSTADANGNSRRVRFTNLDASIIQSVLIFAAGTSLSGKTVADGMKVLGQQTFEFTVTTGMRIGVVAASGTPSYSCIISDFTG